MYRWISLVAVTVTALLGGISAGCTSLSCGTGTTPQQRQDGTVACVPVDEPAAGIDCDVDGGATIVGGQLRLRRPVRARHQALRQ